MKQVFQSYSKGEVSVEDVPAPILRPGGVLVHTRYSIVSAGTERHSVETARLSLMGKARARPDLVAKVLDKVRRDGLMETIRTVRDRLDSPKPLGYSSSGVVIEVGDGVRGLRVGDEVACGGGGYACHAEIAFVPQNLCARVPGGLPLDVAAVGTIGAIALHSIRQAGCGPGDLVAVIGMGLIGQLALQILTACGCRPVGFDPSPAMPEFAAGWGFRDAFSSADAFQDAVRRLSSGRGADAILVCAAARDSSPLELAGAIARDRATVVVVGLTGMTLPRELYYRKELTLRMSRSYGPGRYDPEYEEKGRDYPPGYVRWTEQRNIEAFLALAVENRIQPGRLLTHRFPLDRAVEAYDLLTDEDWRGRYLGILLEYPTALPRRGALDLGLTPKTSPGRLRLGLIGAGNYARSYLLPNLPSGKGVELAAVSTASGLTARHVAARHGAARCHDSPAALLADPDIDAVVIATRHDSHSALAAEALKSGKHVFVEKPLAMDIGGLRAVAAALKSSAGRFLMVGFNRRYSAVCQVSKEFFGTSRPLVINVRVNAGELEEGHWALDPDVGGGRIIGEMCHFVDLVQHLCDSPIAMVHAVAARGGVSGGVEAGGEQDVACVLTLADGSVASIVYTAGGDRSSGKERIEVFGGGRSAVMEDIRRIETFRDGRRKVLRFGPSARGQKSELELFTDICMGRVPVPPRFIEGQMLSSLATILIVEALRTGQPQRVSLESVLQEVRG
ncbi:MAG: bi-domain-containing oxidoreductase [Planctomycetota bacterium]|nr:bi-domain-containing oxidoreductase [Planctomycetota bacterium]